MRILILLLLATLPTFAQTPLSQLHPPVKSAFPRTGAFGITAATPLVIPDAPSPGLSRAVARLRARFGGGLIATPASAYAGGPAIVLTELFADRRLDSIVAATMPNGEAVPRAGGYVIDVTSSRVVIGARDAEGAFNAIATLMQMIAPDGGVAGAHVNDHPDYPVRWVFNQQNLRGVGAIPAMRALLDTMSALKLNAIQQNDFKYGILSMQPEWYFDSVRAYRQMSEARGIGVVPGVASIGYSEGILWNDPHLAEGFPATARYVIEADTGRLIPDSRVALPNGSLESVDANGRFTGWGYYDEATLAVDRAIMHSGSASARGSGFSGANSRFIRTVQCRPNIAYLMTAWMRTEALSGGELRLLAIGTDGAQSSRTLAYTMFALPATTNGWRKVQVVFNTLEFSQMHLYAGLWGGTSGAFWVDDIEIREAGLANVLRREGTPLHVRSTDASREYREGVDFAPVVDTKMTAGYYQWHEPPTFRTLPAGSLRNGDTVDISFYHPMVTYGNEDGIGQTMACVSEDTLEAILRAEIAGVDALYSPPQFFMHHDEIRAMNRDSACLARGLSPAELLADNVRDVMAIIDSVHPGAEVFAWSDMFDSLHNAVDDYFLVNGDLRGVWTMIPKEITIANWNGGASMRASLDFFERHGFSQIATPYYDQRDTRNMRAWRLALEETERAKGMMYTTWSSDYSYVRPFAYYAWGAGPRMIHTPLDATVLARPVLDSVLIEAEVHADPYDATDRITSVTARVDHGGSEELVTMSAVGNDRWRGWAKSIARDRFSYHVVATNAQGLERATPEYVVEPAGTSSVRGDRPRVELRVHPNPVSGPATATFTASGSWRLELVDLLGRVVHTTSGTRHGEVIVPIPSIPSGAYRCVLRTADALSTVPVVIR